MTHPRHYDERRMTYTQADAIMTRMEQWLSMLQATDAFATMPPNDTPVSVPTLRRDGNVRAMDSIQADMICIALKRYGGNVTKAATMLGIGRSTIYRDMERLGIVHR